MQRANTETTEPSFAGFLASIAAPAAVGEVDPNWNNDGLADDVAVLSYEGVPRKPVGRTFGAGAAGAETDAEPGSGAARTAKVTEFCTPGAREKLRIFEVDGPQADCAAKDVKRASVTVRLSAAEAMQLRARAAESGMTISAYLRSCTFEVESLRSQVKDALGRMRVASVTPEQAGGERRSLLSKIVNIWPLGQGA